MDYPLVTIIGNGFGGVYAARALLKLGFRVRLIGREDRFTFMPLLHEVATGTLAESDVSFPLHTFLRSEKFELVIGEVMAVDFETKSIRLATGKILNYEKVVIATGARPRLDTVQGSQYAIPLKSIHDAINIRNRIMALIKDVGTDIAVTIIGGGFTGLELACEIDQLFKHRRMKGALVRLFDKGSLPLATADPRLSQYIKRRLTKTGIEFHGNCQVDEIAVSQVRVNGTDFASDLTVLAVGVAQNTEILPGSVLDERRNLIVEPTLLVKGQRDVFALGDIITINGSAKPAMLAQLAVREALVVAVNIKHQIKNEKLTTYTPKVLGVLLSLGTWDGTGRIFGIPIFGRFAWYVWRTVYLFKTPGWGNRFHIAKHWTTYLYNKRKHIPEV